MLSLVMCLASRNEHSRPKIEVFKHLDLTPRLTGNARAREQVKRHQGAVRQTWDTRRPAGEKALLPRQVGAVKTNRGAVREQSRIRRHSDQVQCMDLT